MLIENEKIYNSKEVETIFFRPSFCGKAAEELGIRVIYNMPMPTVAQVFSQRHDLLSSYVSGWQGGTSSDKLQVTINMSKVKAENAYTAEDYFSTVLELITNSADVNLGDMTGTDLEKAETEMFRRSLAESIYATMWLGDTYGTISNLITFDGFLANMLRLQQEYEDGIALQVNEAQLSKSVVTLLREAWDAAHENLRALASDGNLAYFVSSDVYNAYQFYFDDKDCSAAYTDMVEGRKVLSYHGIPLIEVPIEKYGVDKCKTFCILTDRRNLVLALNTSDSPEKEIRLWYNHDEMENRQRAVFLAGTAILDHTLISGIISHTAITL